MKDQIVEEVRKYRLAHTRQFKGDLSTICDDLLRIQLESGHKIVRHAPQKLVTKTRSYARANKIMDVPNFVYCLKCATTIIYLTAIGTLQKKSSMKLSC